MPVLDDYIAFLSEGHSIYHEGVVQGSAVWEGCDKQNVQRDGEEAREVEPWVDGGVFPSHYARRVAPETTFYPRPSGSRVRPSSAFRLVWWLSQSM